MEGKRCLDTRQTKANVGNRIALGVLIVLISLFCFLCDVGAFGNVGSSVSGFLIGFFGLADYAYSIIGIIVGIAIIFNLKIQIRLIKAVMAFGLLLLGVFALHIFSSSQHIVNANYAGYLLNCYYLTNTAGGMFMGLLGFPIMKALTSVGALILACVLFFVLGFFTLLPTFKKNVTYSAVDKDKRNKKRFEKKNSPEFEEQVDGKPLSENNGGLYVADMASDPLSRKEKKLKGAEGYNPLYPNAFGNIEDKAVSENQEPQALVDKNDKFSLRKLAKNILFNKDNTDESLEKFKTVSNPNSALSNVSAPYTAQRRVEMHEKLGIDSTMEGLKTDAYLRYGSLAVKKIDDDSKNESVKNSSLTSSEKTGFQTLETQDFDSLKEEQIKQFNQMYATVKPEFEAEGYDRAQSGEIIKANEQKKTVVEPNKNGGYGKVKSAIELTIEKAEQAVNAEKQKATAGGLQGAVQRAIFNQNQPKIEPKEIVSNGYERPNVTPTMVERTQNQTKIPRAFQNTALDNSETVSLQQSGYVNDFGKVVKQTTPSNDFANEYKPSTPQQEYDAMNKQKPVIDFATLKKSINVNEYYQQREILPLHNPNDLREQNQTQAQRAQEKVVSEQQNVRVQSQNCTSNYRQTVQNANSNLKPNTDYLNVNGNPNSLNANGNANSLTAKGNVSRNYENSNVNGNANKNNGNFEINKLSDSNSINSNGSQIERIKTEIATQNTQNQRVANSNQSLDFQQKAENLHKTNLDIVKDAALQQRIKQAGKDAPPLADYEIDEAIKEQRAKTAKSRNLQAAEKIIKQMDSIDDTNERLTQVNIEQAISQATPKSPYIAPPIELLTRPDPPVMEDEDYDSKKAILIDTLASFGIKSEVIDREVGPTFSLYSLKVEMPKGRTVGSITNLENDIAMQMEEESVRILAPIPGKNAVGIEVPNKHRRIVRLSELLMSPSFNKAKSPASFGLGKNLYGENFVCDIKELPHMLIAGATGAGKSCCINSVIVSLLYKASPEEVRLILIDPKRMELSVYAGIPHLLLDEIVCDVDKAIRALNWAISEMDRRIKYLSELKYRNIDEYNNDCSKHGYEKMPRIVVIVDELADLIAMGKKSVEDAINRIARLARAVGIHLILATQRPSVDVVSGTIKNNLPSRVAFKVTSGPDSRTILDSVGADKLLGYGDLLYMTPKSSMLERMQGAFISNEEVQKVVDFIKTNNESYFDNSIKDAIFKEQPDESQQAKEKTNNKKQSLPPELFDALRLGLEGNNMSISYLQRKLGLGWPKAAKISDMMEDMGYLVKDPTNPKTKIVKITQEELDELIETNEEGEE